jgi:hypothetical protein
MGYAPPSDECAPCALGYTKLITREEMDRNASCSDVDLEALIEDAKGLLNAKEEN